MDPLADKLLVCSALICLVATGQLAAWMVIVIISREFIISGFRLVASDNGVVIAASYWGKFKTTFQMLMIIVLILNLPGTFFEILGILLTWVALILTIISLCDYLIKNKDVLKELNDNFNINMMYLTESTGITMGYTEILNVDSVCRKLLPEKLKPIYDRMVKECNN